MDGHRFQGVPVAEQAPGKGKPRTMDARPKTPPKTALPERPSLVDQLAALRADYARMELREIDRGLAKMMGLTLPALKALIASGELPSVPHGKRATRVRWRDVLEWMQANGLDLQRAQ